MRNSKQSIVLLMLAAGVSLIGGCGESRPAGMPELYPVSMTITQGGSPLADATVTFYSEDSTLRRWTVGGVTDPTGTAKLMTQMKYAGAPAGTYKVMVNKTESEGDPKPAHPGVDATPEQLAQYDRAMKTGSFKQFKVVPKTYRNAGDTPLSIEIKAGQENIFTEDIGAAVREEDKQGGADGGADTYTPMGG